MNNQLKNKNPWEKIYEDQESSTKKMKVKDGWIVKYETWNLEGNISSSLVFVRDIEHLWNP